MTKQLEALQPCPFCGSDDVGVFEQDADDCPNRSAIVRCFSCDAQSAQMVGKEKLSMAIRAWNKRVIQEPSQLAVKLPSKIERDDTDGWFKYRGSRVGGGAAEWYNKAIDDIEFIEPTAGGLVKGGE